MNFVTSEAESARDFTRRHLYFPEAVACCDWTPQQDETKQLNFYLTQNEH
ncbi:hypothetical protein [Pontibacter vulgaris]|nr:hypothetical protein [Pontibacter vulgaris]